MYTEVAGYTSISVLPRPASRREAGANTYRDDRRASPRSQLRDAGSHDAGRHRLLVAAGEVMAAKFAYSLVGLYFGFNLSRTAAHVQVSTSIVSCGRNHLASIGDSVVNGWK